MVRCVEEKGVCAMKLRAAIVLCACMSAILFGMVGEAEAVGSYKYVEKWGTEGTDEGCFDHPMGVAIDPTSTFIYVADIGNHVVQKCDLVGNCPITWGGEGNGDGQFLGPIDVDCDAAGNVYVVDSNNFRIQKFDRDGRFISSWGSLGSGDGQFANPIGIAVDRVKRRVYVTDSHGYIGGTTYWNARVQKFDLYGRFITKWGEHGRSSSRGAPPSGRFNTPWGIAVDGDGNVYVADTNNDRIQKFTSDGTHVATWGGCGASDPYCASPAAPGRFGSPTCIAIDSEGNILVSDHPYGNIRKYSSDGDYILSFGTPGGGNGQLNRACGIAFDASGLVYVADGSNHRIQKFRYVKEVPLVRPVIPSRAPLKRTTPLRPITPAP